MFVTHEREDGAFDGCSGDVPLRGCIVADDDGTGFDDRTANRTGSVTDIPVNRFDGRVVGERFDVGGTGFVLQCSRQSVFDGGFLLFGEGFEVFGLDLEFVVSEFDFANQSGDVTGIDFGVGTNACLLEGGTVHDGGFVAEFEHRRTARLTRTDDFALDSDALADSVAQRLDGDAFGLFGL